MERVYAVKEMFWTLQGEGVHAMRACVFVRFAGCNLWTGVDGRRGADAERNGALCPLFCDTDFNGGDRLTAAEIVARALELGAGPDVFVVFTGGEPLLQLDAALVRALRVHGVNAHLETNGTLPLSADLADALAWVCVSPKVAPERLRILACSELKVVFPRYDPTLYASAVRSEAHFLQPEDGAAVEANTLACVEFVRANPRWRVSIQQHKLLGLP